MLGPTQKACLIQSIERSIRAIRLKKITDPAQIQSIIASALEYRRKNIITDFSEIKTSSNELLSLLP